MRLSIVIPARDEAGAIESTCGPSLPTCSPQGPSTLPLEAVTRGYSYAIVPTSWTNRAAGESAPGPADP
jgi:hypothetical protein